VAVGVAVALEPGEDEQEVNRSKRQLTESKSQVRGMWVEDIVFFLLILSINASGSCFCYHLYGSIEKSLHSEHREFSPSCSLVVMEDKLCKDECMAV
jgi:hypothetical protein